VGWNVAYSRNILRSLDAVEYIDGGTVIDAANNTEKRGIADAQDLRNSIAHEYETENISRFFAKVLEFTSLFKIVIEKINNYCSRYLS
jgi:hypothetical protein